MKRIHDVSPREVIGRDMVLRVNMQHQAAAYAALEILKGGKVDRIYCDYHDDFVVRRNTSGTFTYHFFQVKTKGKLNQLWTSDEIFSIKNRGQKEDSESLKAVGESFVGRLLSHTTVFGDACSHATLLTNTQFNKAVENLIKELCSGGSGSKGATFVQKHFNTIFNVTLTEEQANAHLKKLSLLPGVTYIGQEHEFAAAAGDQIYRYSEIDLSRGEVKELAAGLVSLINRKTISKIAGLTPGQLDKAASVGLNDLLSVLSISKSAYQALLNGGDHKALKNASIIQRRLEAAGASEEMVAYASEQKVAWDIWLREARHIYQELDLNFLLQCADDIRSTWERAGGKMIALQQVLETNMQSSTVSKFPSLKKDLLFGGVMAAFVRQGTR